MLTTEEAAMAVRSMSDTLRMSAYIASRISRLRLHPPEMDIEELIREALSVARRMADISDRLNMAADRMAQVTDAQAVARVDMMLEPVRILLDEAFDALMHLDADIAEPKEALVMVCTHLDGARHKLREIMEGDHGQA